jgi:hypothetical protein
MQKGDDKLPGVLWISFTRSVIEENKIADGP